MEEMEEMADELASHVEWRWRATLVTFLATVVALLLTTAFHLTKARRVRREEDALGKTLNAGDYEVSEVLVR